jgi:hypothetical protein
MEHDNGRPRRDDSLVQGNDTVDPCVVAEQHGQQLRGCEEPWWLPRLQERLLQRSVRLSECVNGGQPSDAVGKRHGPGLAPDEYCHVTANLPRCRRTQEERTLDHKRRPFAEPAVAATRRGSRSAATARRCRTCTTIRHWAAGPTCGPPSIRRAPKNDLDRVRPGDIDRSVRSNLVRREPLHGMRRCSRHPCHNAARDRAADR